MEVEPRILNFITPELLNHFTHFLANPLLTALLVNQVDEVLTIILCIRFLEVLVGGIKAGLVVGVDVDTGTPRHRRLHLPDERD